MNMNIEHMVPTTNIHSPLHLSLVPSLVIMTNFSFPKTIFFFRRSMSFCHHGSSYFLFQQNTGIFFFALQ